MSDFYTSTQRKLQDEFESRGIADRLVDAIVTDELSEHQIEFITARNMFFLSTVDEDGFPSCSYKGGATGFVRVINAGKLVFPNYDGNGMFMSLGNIEAKTKVGLLFINFEIPQRLRLRGEAKLIREGPMVASFPGAFSVTELLIEKVWQNCPRYIHSLEAKKLSPYLPRSDGSFKFPPWKRINIIQDALSGTDQKQAETLGLITPEAYAEMESRGDE